MDSDAQNVCCGCGEAEGKVLLERCSICGKHFCRECGHRAFGGAMFCSEPCARAATFFGDDDDADSGPDDDD